MYIHCTVLIMKTQKQVNKKQFILVFLLFCGSSLTNCSSAGKLYDLVMCIRSHSSVSMKILGLILSLNTSAPIKPTLLQQNSVNLISTVHGVIRVYPLKPRHWTFTSSLPRCIKNHIILLK